MDFKKYDPFQVFEVCPVACTVVYVKVIRGYNITKGWRGDLIDTPDPYVTMFIETSPNAIQRTTTIDNNINPEWNETFSFFCDPREENILELALIDANYVYDELLSTVKINLKDELPEGGKVMKTIQFNETSEVDIEMWKDCHCQPELRFSLSLPIEEHNFLEKRTEKVYRAMKRILGKDAPQSPRDVPVIGVLGSGGGFRAMTAYSGVFTALVDSQILDMVTYAASLSGSSWYLSQLYSNPEWPQKTPGELRGELQENIERSPFWLLGPNSMYKYVTRIIEKRRQGQPISFTDFFGHLVGETILSGRDSAKLTDQQKTIQDGNVPMPLYTCLHVKKQVSPMRFHEWMEFSPYEIGLPKYGTFMKTGMFGSKFFMGHLVKEYPEPPLHFLQGIWGSAFCIQFHRLLKDDKKITKSNKRSHIKYEEYSDDEREELEKELLQDMSTLSSTDSDSSDNEDDELGRAMSENPFKKLKQKEMNNNATPKSPTESKRSSFWMGMLQTLFDKNGLLKSIEGRAAKVHSFMRGLALYKVYPFSPFTSVNADQEHDQFDGIFEMYPTTMKKLYVVDGGLTFNSPYPLLLRPQRQVDLLLSFDFSARPSDETQPFKELLLAERWAEINSVPFPKIDPKVFEKEGMKECYIFQDSSNPKCPIVMHFALANVNFRNEKAPGVPRTTQEEKDFGDFSIFDNPDHPYSTFNFKYKKLDFDRLTQLMEYNTLRSKDLIIDKIKECIKRRQMSLARRPIKLKDIKKLRLKSRKSEKHLEMFLQSFDVPEEE